MGQAAEAVTTESCKGLLPEVQGLLDAPSSGFGLFSRTILGRDVSILCGESWQVLFNLLPGEGFLLWWAPLLTAVKGWFPQQSDTRG